jgi:hypothetical protein
MQGQEVGRQSQKGKRGISQEKHNQELAIMTMNLKKKVRSGQNRATTATRRGSLQLRR